MSAITIAPLEPKDLHDLLDLKADDHAALLAHLRWCISTPYAIALEVVFGEALICGVGSLRCSIRYDSLHACARTPSRATAGVHRL